MVLVVAAALAMIACDQGPTIPSIAPEAALLVTQGLGSATELLALRPDGSGRRRLTDNGVAESSPDWSPDGARIVFMSAQVPKAGQQFTLTDVVVMEADGSRLRRLTEETQSAGHPRWSPDGQRILFDRFDAQAGKFRVHVLSSDGTGARPLTSSLTDNFSAEWSPDGASILYLSNRVPRAWWTVYVTRVDGTGERQLAGDEACRYNVDDARWSPNGSRIAYTCSDSYGQGIYVMGADGAGAVRLSAPSGPQAFSYDFGPVWSPDGGTLAFTSGRGGAFDVYTMPATGGSASRITHDAVDVNVGAWRASR